MGQLYEGMGQLEKAVASYRRYIFTFIPCHRKYSESEFQLNLLIMRCDLILDEI